MQEVWKIWKETYNTRWGYRCYEVSNFGNVKINSELQIPKNTQRYYYLAGELLHRLVAELFIPNPNDKPQVDHIDTNKHNNRADNLRWVTQSENNNNPITKQRMSNVKKGRVLTEEARQKISLANKGKGIGKIWINNGIESKLIHPSDIENYQGYEIGRIDVNKGRKYSTETKDKLRQSHIGKTVGKIWINNGIESKMIFPQDIDKYIGYVKGRCTK